MIRLRIERIVRLLPTTVIAVPPESSRIRQRLTLSIGEADLSPDARLARIITVQAVGAAYDEICEILHGRNPDSNPPIVDVEAWEQSVRLLEEDLAIVRTMPPPRKPSVDHPQRASAARTQWTNSG